MFAGLSTIYRNGISNYHRVCGKGNQDCRLLCTLDFPLLQTVEPENCFINSLLQTLKGMLSLDLRSQDSPEISIPSFIFYRGLIQAW